MPWVVRDAVRDINRAVARRWQATDPLLPDPSSMPAGCGEPLVVNADGGRMVGLGMCVHHHVPADSLNQTWGAADRFMLTPRLTGQDIYQATDALVSQWRDHLGGVAAARGEDTSAGITWPSRDITGVRALLRHGLQPLTVIAARTRPAGQPRSPRQVPGVTIRAAGSRDEEQVLDLELQLIRYDGHFGGPVWRRDTAYLVRQEVRATLERQAMWTWLAERDGRAIGLLVTQPPVEAGWIAGMTARAPAAYLQTMFVVPQERDTGVGAVLVRTLHARLDSAGVAVTLLHHSQVNPLSGPFWNRMGYRPLWTSWEARPARALR
ncbi:MAG TPA: GNAT family N-acetyltransferase [Trebonia sp.]|nr:GNAT family N-acetyltransferase [Trebonia sp.]